MTGNYPANFPGSKNRRHAIVIRELTCNFDQLLLKRLLWRLFALTFVALFFFPKKSFSQNPCGASTPVFYVNLSSSINATWISPNTGRADSCCGSQNPNTCVEFIVTLNPLSTGVIFDIYSGASPPGALYYQINCSPPTPVGEPFCLSGVGPHIITFCKPGGNSNEYIIQAVPNVIVSADITINNGCFAEIGATGFQEATVSWNSIFPGPSGAYNSYLNCTTGCDTVTVTGQPGAPPYVDYVICGITIDGCSTTPYCDTVRVYFNPTLITNITPVNPVLCFGNPGLNLTANTTGGSPPYTYLWSNAATTQTIFAGPGSYTVTVQDTSGCPASSATVTVTTYTAAITANAGPNMMVCATSPSVTLSGSVTGVTTGIWSGGTGTFSPSDTVLNATYTPSSTEMTNGIATLILTTTNNGPCPPGVDTVVITINSFTAEADATPSNVSCSGFNNGSATANVTGGFPPFTYSWSTTPVQTTPVAINLSPGNYTVVVTDANGCTGSATVQISEPPAMALSMGGFATPCFGSCTGQTVVLPSGGSGSYTYLWQPGNITTAAATNLCPGTYTVTVTDINGCSLSDSATVTEPPQLTLSASSTPAYCNLATGSATATPSGGTGSFTYLWQPGGQTTNSINNIFSGSYTVTVTDANNCTQTAIINVGNTPGVTASVTNVISSACNSSCTGSATALATGGISPYQYAWSNSQTTATATNLCAGNYTVIITDAGACQQTATVTITSPPALVLTAGTVPLICVGQSTTMSATATGGVLPYSYTWLPSGPVVSPTVTTTYTVNVTDGNGCQAIAQQVTVQVNPPLSLNTTPISTPCFGTCAGQITASPSGGSGSFSYLWQPGNITTASVTGLCPGTYTITVTDLNGCTVGGSASVTQPAAVTLTTSSTPAYCNLATGSATATPSGGTGNFTYMWLPGGQTTNVVSNIFPGLYTVTVTDANNCTQTATVTIANTPGVNASVINVVPPLCNNSCDGSATATATGGIAPYQYAWSGPQTTATAINLCAGNHTVIVTDAGSCTDTVVLNLTAPSPLVLSTGTVPTICIGQSATMTANANGGTAPYTYSWSPAGPLVSPATTTTYTVSVTDTNGCTTSTQPVTVQVNPPLAVSVSGNALVCMNSLETLLASGAGGNGGPYSYAWQPTGTFGNTVTDQPISNTVYTVTLTDNCTTTPATATFAVTVPPLPVASFTSNDTSGCGTVCVDFTNTTPNTQSVFWSCSDGYTSSLATPHHCFHPGTFDATLIVTDNNGCKDTLTQASLITVHSNPVADFILGPQPTTILEPDICFTDHSSPDVISWYWNFDDPNDLATGTIQNPCHAYSDTGRYCTSLIVTNQYGCWSTTMNCLYIEPYFTLYVPNAFTPNGDGLNDLFLPVGDDVDRDNYELMIFDRWGNLIFRTVTWGEGWNGIAKGGNKICQVDTYVWKVNLKDHLGQRHQLVGHVSIIK